MCYSLVGGSVRVYLEIVEAGMDYTPSPQPMVRVDVTGLDRESIISQAKALLEQLTYVKPLVRIHYCYNEEGRPCILEDITSEVIS